MANAQSNVKRRYPVRAIAAVAGAAVVTLFNLVVCFLFMALVPPLIPVFVSVMFGGVCLLGRALAYAESVSVRVPAAMLPGTHAAEVERRRYAPRAA